MRTPSATYRVQLHKDFRFSDAQALLPYLQRLGISHLYASPVFQARRGSMHGYDVTDPTRVNSELGTEAEFDALAGDLRARGMYLLLDIVPNHMAASPENPWWMDVLENGSASRHAGYFDVEWGHGTPSVQDKIVLPILGKPYGDALEEQELQLRFDQCGLRVFYFASGFPLDPATYHQLLAYRPDDRPASPELDALLETASRLPSRVVTDWEAVESRQRDGAEFRRDLCELHSTQPAVASFIDENIRIFNGTKSDSASFDLLDELLEAQAYRLTFWRAARERINYRRFFDVTDLIGIRAKDPQVFEATHELVLRWVAEGKVSGLRIDHVDGLYDPAAYLARLQARASTAAGSAVYVTVEKILSGGEDLSSDWPIAGTTGYEFLGAVNNLFVHPTGLGILDEIYSSYTQQHTTLYQTAYTQKKKIMEDLFAGEMRTLGLHLSAIADRYRHARDLSPEALTAALTEVTASMPVYRTYMHDFSVTGHDRAVIEDAIRQARNRNQDLPTACFNFLRRVLLCQLHDSQQNNDEDALRFVMRWQQITGPVMAKGVEDTSLYLFNRLTSMNDVGGSPEPVSIDQFHQFNAARHQLWPGTMNATSTHDTKRSEDVRARLNLLSEMAPEWGRYVNRWRRWNRLATASAFPAQDPNHEYLLYQTLLGAWPLDGQITPEFTDRIKAYLIKSAREAKLHTSWLHNNREYERTMTDYLDAILRDDPDNKFLPSFRAFQTRIAFYGAMNSLSQTVLKIASPGVPDFYQGTGRWDLSLVDPDNRRPDQIQPHPEMLEGFEQFPPLLDQWPDGRVKMFVIFHGLQLRQSHPDLFQSGDYLGLPGEGLAAEHTVALARRLGQNWVIAVVPRFLTELTALEKWPLGGRFWKDARIPLPPDAPRRWTNVYTGETVQCDNALAIADIFKTFPVALLTGE